MHSRCLRLYANTPVRVPAISCERLPPLIAVWGCWLSQLVAPTRVWLLVQRSHVGDWPWIQTACVRVRSFACDFCMGGCMRVGMISWESHKPPIAFNRKCEWTLKQLSLQRVSPLEDLPSLSPVTTLKFWIFHHFMYWQQWSLGF